MFGCKTSCCTGLACCLGHCLLLTRYREGNDSFKSGCKLPCTILLVSGGWFTLSFRGLPQPLFVVLLEVFIRYGIGSSSLLSDEKSDR